MMKPIKNNIPALAKVPLPEQPQNRLASANENQFYFPKDYNKDRHFNDILDYANLKNLPAIATLVLGGLKIFADNHAPIVKTNRTCIGKKLNKGKRHVSRGFDILLKQGIIHRMVFKTSAEIDLGKTLGFNVAPCFDSSPAKGGKHFETWWIKRPSVPITDIDINLWNDLLKFEKKHYPKSYDDWCKYLRFVKTEAMDNEKTHLEITLFCPRHIYDIYRFAMEYFKTRIEKLASQHAKRKITIFIDPTPPPIV